MLTTKDLLVFKDFLESGAWADAFAHAGPELRAEMIAKAEALLDAADMADRVVGQVMFSSAGRAAPATTREA